MNKEHKKILAEIKKNRGKGTKHSSNDSYLSSGHFYYDVSNPVRRSIAKDWLKKNKSISQKDFLALIDSLYKGKSHEEKTMASMLLGYHSKFRSEVGPKQLDKWLNYLVGWSEIDSICQNVFTAEELLKDWNGWKSFVQKLSKDKNINKRRASLVLLTGPGHRSKDKRIAVLAFELINRLKHEKPILITKAISWLLRDMTRFHKKEVTEFLKKNEKSLPKIAVRETWRKIRTGRK